MERNVASRIGLTLGLILCMFLLSTSNVASHTTPQLASKPPSSVDQPISTAALQIADGGQAVNHNWRAWQQLSPQLQAKVDLRILAELRGDVLPAHVAEIASPDAIQPQTHQPLAQTRFLLYLDHQPDPTTLREVVVASQLDQRAAVMQSLLATTQREQAALRAFLAQKTQAQQATAYQPFFIVNALAVEGGLDLVIALAKRDDVARLIANYPLVPSTSASLNFAPAPANPDFAIANFFTPTALDPTNWNIELVRADRVWTELGVRGAGAVVAGFDTGVTFRHPALVGHYRGNLGNGRFDHNYNWFEPDGNLYPNGDLGPSVSQEPITCGTHGTHTLGTAVGDSGLTGTQVGMAPAATWIALPGICGTTMSGGIRDDIGGIKAFQWLLCPTDLSGNLATADCSKAPDVVNNSWGAANPTGELFRPIIRALRAANIAPVFAAGNPRALNGSIGSPGNAPEAITVGATDRNDQIAPFSGRGPSFYPNEQKPELSAPGVEVKSSVAGSSYETSSGTSMAAPHVTGLIALMVAADLQDGVRDFSIDELEAFMQLTAVDLGAPGPDPDYGYGRIDAYNAVRAVLQAGDLRGTVRSSSTMQPLPDATVIGRGSAPFTTQTNAQGVYSLTVPADLYQLQVRAWGYVTATFSNQSVVAGALAVADFALQPLPTVAIRGVVRAGNTPVADALIYVKAAPGIRSNSAVDGQYRLTLPVGVHTLVMVKNGYRRAELTVSVTVSGPTQVDIATERAPTILLVEADAYRGWFDGWPIGAIFRMALDEQAYLYEEWPIQYTNKTDQVTLPDGNVGYGLPSLATLRNYEVVIWAQSGCNTGLQGCFYANAPTPLGASATLREYMDGGGRLILSGQDLGYWEDGSTLFEDYLHTSLIADSAAAEGDSLTGSGFLTGTTLTITNASLYGYANGALQLAPDALAAETNGAVAYPILTYDNIQLPAALAIDPCDADYRAVYFGVGFENIGPRGANRDPAIAATLGGAVEWVTGSRLAADLTATVNQPIRFAEAGQQLIYQVEIANAGRNALRLVPAIAGTTWPVQLFVDEADTLHPIAEPIQLSPCQTIKVAVAVDIPTATPNDTREQWTLTLLTSDLQGIAQPQLTRVLDLTTGVFATWQGDAPLPTPRYRLGAVALSGIPGQTADAFYAIGGWYNLDLLPNLADSNAASVANERFDSCTGQWESRKPLPAPRAGAAVATVNGQIYLMGGSTHLRSVPPTLADPHANLWRYNPTSDTWQELAPVPVALAGAAAVGLGGKIYLFGGIDAEGLLSRRTYSYDIATNQWTTGTAIPGAGRAFTAAVRVGDKVALVGGYPALNAVHFYDPIVDRWQVGPPLQQGRHSMGIAVTATGALYVVGGAVGNRGVATVERLDAGAQQWRSMPMLLDDGRYGAAAAYVDGRIVTVGGSGGLGGSESLIVDGSFCNADYQSTRTVVAIGEPIVYEIQLRGDTVALPTAGFRNPLPAQLHFNGFVANEVGAAYDPKSHTITWQGKLAAGATPPPIRYRVTADPVVVQNGAHITSTVLFDSGQGLTVLRTAEVALLSTALDGSYKAVDKVRARSGETLTYTINVQGDSYISSTLTLADPLPAPLRYLPNSLRYDNGVGRYDAATGTIRWEGNTVRSGNAFFNLAGDYVWGDSDGAGRVGTVPYRWIEVKETGVEVEGGDNSYYCDLPIGFDFPFYSRLERTFCVSTNGFVSFDQAGDAGDSAHDCPLPNGKGNRALIAAIWGDLVVTNAIYYQSFGTAPQRYLVIQWQGVRRYNSLGGRLANFQVVLFENGVIRVAIQEAGELHGLTTTTGIEDYTESAGVTYACNQPGALYDQQAILFVPPGGTIGAAQAQIQFQAVIDATIAENGTQEIIPPNAAIGVNVVLTNSVQIATARAVITRQVATLLNPLDLSQSTFVAEQSELTPERVTRFALVLTNSGLVSATNATLTVALPASLAYEADSVVCTFGSCRAAAGTVSWQGLIAPEQPSTIYFGARLVQGLPDRTPITVTANLADGFGASYPLQTIIVARRSDLSRSQLQFQPRFAEPGSLVTLLALVQNTGGLATNAAATISIPPNLVLDRDSLVCGTGVCQQIGERIQWQGVVGPRELVPIRFTVQIPATTAYGTAFAATLVVDDMDWQDQFTQQTELMAMHTYLLPIVIGGGARYLLYLPWVAQ